MHCPAGTAMIMVRTAMSLERRVKCSPAIMHKLPLVLKGNLGPAWEKDYTHASTGMYHRSSVK